MWLLLSLGADLIIFSFYMKQIIGKWCFATVAIVFILVPFIVNASESLEINFFYSKTCPHCAKEEAFLPTLEQEYGGRIKINKYEISSAENQEVFFNFIKNSGKNINGVPATFIGEDVIVGYLSDTTTGQQIRHVIDENLALLSGDVDNQELVKSLPVKLPVFGEVNLMKYSLFGVTIIVAAIDGFNPCAMWVLLFLITMLLGMKNRRRMWILGLTFIASSALVYFIFLAAWLNFFKFIGVVRPVQIVVGLVALGVGLYYLRRFWKTRPGQCEVTNPQQRQKLMDKIKRTVSQQALWLALLGIIGLAVIVNFIELACSAGLPAIFTQVLALNDVPAWQHYLYLILYIIIFMLDDMIVFAIAMVTLKTVSTSGKYSRWGMLIGGLVIMILGILLVAKPEWVMFR